MTTDTKRSLWYWESIPRRDGGLGHVDIPLACDVNGTMGRDYGVLVQEDGLDLQGMFMLNGEGIVQQVRRDFFRHISSYPCTTTPSDGTHSNEDIQITLNSEAVHCSVSETLRLLEAYQAIAKQNVSTPWMKDSTSKLSIVGERAKDDSIVPCGASPRPTRRPWTVIKNSRRLKALIGFQSL